MRIGFLLLLLPLAACASHKPMYAYWQTRNCACAGTAPKPEVVTSPFTPDPIDGSYQGTVYLTSAPNRDGRHWWKRPSVGDDVCPRNSYGVIEVADHTLYYAYSPALVFAAPIAADGTLSQTIDGGSVTGRVHDGRLTFNIVTPICTSRFFGDFKLNHS